MNIDFNNTSIQRTANTAAPQATAPLEKGQPKTAPGGVTFTRAAADPEALAAAEIPDSALDRDDALGRLVSAAFNLPPPPFPVAQ